LAHKAVSASLVTFALGPSGPEEKGGKN